MNLYDYAVPAAGRENMVTLLQNKRVRIERIVSNKAATQWYDQEEDEWIVLLKGSATIVFEDDTVQLEAGDTLLLEAHRRHRVVQTSEDALWLTVFYQADNKMC